MKEANRPIRNRLNRGFAIIISISTIAVVVMFYQIRHISGTTQLIYEHPLQVSNAVRDIQISINAIHRSMKDIALTANSKDIDSIVNVINKHNASALDAFSLIFHKYLGPRSDIDSSFYAFMEWQPIRNEVIQLKKEGKDIQAADITRGKGAKHVEKLFFLTGKMGTFAQNKAIETYDTARKREKLSIILIAGIVFMVLTISIYVARRIAKSISLPINSITDRIASLITLQSNKFTYISKHIAEEDILDLSVKELEDAYKLNRDNNAKLKSFNEALEKEVKSRTSELESSKEKLHIKNQEYEAINEELTATNEEMEATNEELSETNSLLSKALQKAEEADKLKTAFLANMSHEIRTPMNGILGFAELLKNNELTEKQHEKYLSVIHSSGNQLLSIVNNILDVSKIEAGTTEFSFQEVHLNKIIELVYDLFSQNASEKSISLKILTPPDMPDDTVYTDETKLRQILINLVHNAIKFTNEGSVSLGYTSNKDFIEFFIEDTGIGIAQDKHSHIFDRFAQTGEITDPEHSGTGLGLTICKGFVELMGGEIWVESNPGAGSTFKFTIPNRIVPNGKHKEPIPKINSILPKATILIAEDTIENFEFLNEILINSQITVHRAVNGKEAVNMVEELKDIDLVLMDIKMPVMDGLEATKHIKKIKPDLPVIAQTAYAMISEKTNALEAGCDDYISKPIEVSLLLQKLNQYLHKPS